LYRIEEIKNKILCGDALEVLKTFPDNSIDTIITDPPYALGFMGKAWDKFPSDIGPKKPFANQSKEQKLGGTGYQEWTEQWAKEALRVAKPGATLLCFGGTRTWHRLACGLEDAGWIIKDTLMWIYGCLSEDTEILTINGWEHYHKDIDKYPVLCYNVNNDNFEFHKPTRKFLYENEYPAYRIKSDFTDQIVSRNHRILIEREGKFIFQRAETLQPEENIPILESLQDLPETIYDFQSHTGIKKSDLLKRVSQNSNTKKQEEEAITRKKDEKNKMSDLWQRFLASFGLDKKEQQPLLFKTLCGKSKRLVKEDRIFRQKKLDRKEFRKLSPKNDWGKQPVLERWSNLFQKTRQLFANKICQMSKRIFNYGSERWLCYGTSAYNGTKIGQTVIKNGSGSSYQSQPSRQQNRESYIVSKQQRTQTIRNTRAKIEEIEYKGNVWCVEVPTGAFVARRSGKIFITGNSGFPKATDISKQLDKRAGRAREVIGKYKVPNIKGDAYGTMNEKQGGSYKNIEQYITAPATPEAQLWNGWKSHSLKPAWEPIIMAMKPNEGSYTENALKWGVAGLNIDGGRIGISGGVKKVNIQPNSGGFQGKGYGCNGELEELNKGRFPANVILECICDEVIEGKHTNPECPCHMLDKQSGINTSRFFYVAKASRKERNMGGVNNNHPTVKSLKLMEYLCLLTKTPTGGIVLDPFAGSGTTCMAAKRIGRDYIGIEKEKEYVEIATKRIEAIPNPLFLV